LSRILFLTLLVILVGSSQLFAAGAMSIDIYGPSQNRLNIYNADPLSKDTSGPAAAIPNNAPEELRQLINRNCGFMAFLSVMSPRDIVGGPSSGGYAAPNIDFNKFQLSRADIVVTAAWVGRPGSVGEVELRAYNVSSGQLIVGKGYSVATQQQLPEVAARFCADLMEALTGQGDFFRSNLAVVKREGERKQIYMVSAQGVNPQKLTNLDGVCMSPAWSHDGQKLVFVFLDKRMHNLCIWDRGSRQISKVRLPGNTIVSPSFMHSGNIAVSLDFRGNAEIYELRSDFSVARALEENWAIEVSPDFDQTGQKMVFTSNRLGGPQIFMKDIGGTARRISLSGSYNTGPTISPDGSQVVYSKLGGGAHKLFLVETASGRERQLTFGPGSDEDPTWSPDGYFIAFSSSRAGGYQVYVTTKNGDEPILVPTGPGEATSPAFGKL